MTPEELAQWYGVAEWDAHFDELAQFAMGKPIYFSGRETATGDPAAGVWVVPPPKGAESFEFLMVSRDGRLQRGRMVMSTQGDNPQIGKSLQAMIDRTEEIHD